MAGKIILASSSPRRADILKKHNLEYEIMPSPYIEEHTTTVFSFEYIEKLAYNKAKAVAELVKEPAIVIGADTMVVLDGEILGKPKDGDEALKMLKRLVACAHKVITSIVLIDTVSGRCLKSSTTSRVIFSDLKDSQLRSYIKNYKPFDKAGAYGIQEMPQGFIMSYSGDIENIMGLSFKVLEKMLEVIQTEKT